jgi:hypothetical protein
MTNAPQDVSCESRDRPDGKVEISPEMKRAGEIVLERACESAGLDFVPFSILASAADVYTAMYLEKHQRREGPPQE